MSLQVAGDLSRGGYGARTIGIKIRYDDFTRVSRDLSLSRSTSNPADVEQAALACLDRLAMRRRIRLLGVKASNLERADDAVGAAAVLMASGLPRARRYSTRIDIQRRDDQRPASASARHRM